MGGTWIPRQLAILAEQLTPQRSVPFGHELAEGARGGPEVVPILQTGAVMAASCGQPFFAPKALEKPSQKKGLTA